MKIKEEGGSVLILPRYALLKHIPPGNLICQLPWPNVHTTVAFTFMLSNVDNSIASQWLKLI